jgi:hypothetical protein
MTQAGFLVWGGLFSGGLSGAAGVGVFGLAVARRLGLLRRRHRIEAAGPSPLEAPLHVQGNNTHCRRSVEGSHRCGRQRASVT